MKLVGILNVTPDSFSDGGFFNEPNRALDHFKQLLSDGASFVDIGAESTRPGSQKIDPETEWERLAPIVDQLLPRYSDKISIDTYHPETAERVLKEGNVIINDVTGFSNPAMIDIIVKYHAKCIICHFASKDIQSVHEGDLLNDPIIVRDYLLDKYNYLISLGLDGTNIILDPGIGFGKTTELNTKLLSISKLLPKNKVMIGYSRKRFLGESRFDIKSNIEAGQIAKAAGASYLRVHDVAGHHILV